MRNNSLFKLIVLVVSVTFFVSCDKDYNVVGDALIGENNFDLTSDNTSTVQASWNATGPISSNNLAVNSLGILDNAVFGQTTANFATQVQLVKVAPVIQSDLGQTIESVTLYVPYYTKPITAINATTGRPIYTLDSIYGNKTSKIKLSIYENEYHLTNENTEFGATISDLNYPRFYYTHQDATFDTKKGDLLYNNDAFVFSDQEYVITVPATTTGAAATTTYVAPGMRVELDKVFFQKLLFDKTSLDYSLKDNPTFERYFKGLYFKTEKADPTGVLARLNFKDGTIVVKYKEKVLATDPAVSVDKSITLNLTGNTVNLFNNEPSTNPFSYSSPKAERLYLRGGEGSIATIDLFDPSVDGVKYNRTTKTIDNGSNDVPDELDYIKENRWLINEAYLTFYIDQSLMAGVPEPTRLFLYDIHNLRILSVGVIEKDALGRGIKYRVSIKDYMRSLINNDSKNVKLGISVAQSVANVNFSKVASSPTPYSVWNSLLTIEKNSYFYPSSSVTCPLGTILYSSDATELDKKLKLEIYYTKPN